MLDEFETRARAASRLARAFEGDGVETDVDVARLGKRAEICVWNAIILDADPSFPLSWEAKEFRYRYTTRVVALEQALKNVDGLRRRVTSGELSLKRLASMKPWEIAPDAWEKSFDMAAKKQLVQTLGDAESMPDGAAECRKCKSKKTTYTQLQTRAADEPCTNFFLCHSCGTRWKTN
jgi:DNA-directed RNA polymerase subunit M/transcription elongation factor TFIIS